MRSYLAIAVLTCVATLAAVLAATTLVDPYGLHGWPAAWQLAPVKPASYIQVHAAKSRRFVRQQPETVVLGNSRVDIGFDPDAPTWPDTFRPVFNFGIPGGGLYDVLRAYLLARDSGVRRMVIGLDFMDFLSAAAPAGGLDRYAPLETGLSPDLLLRSHLSIRATADMLRTMLAQGDPHAETMTPAGFNPLHQYVPILRREGHAAVAEQRSRQNIVSYLRRPRLLTARDGGPNRPMAELGLLLADARRAGIELHLFTYPYHADLLETLIDLGLWPLVEEWKRQVHALAAAPETRVASLWDFAVYSAYTTEPIPPDGDRTTEMRWYWEPGHFKSALGDRLIEAMFAGVANGAGTDLLTTDVEVALAAVRSREARYRRDRPADAARIERLIAELR